MRKLADGETTDDLYGFLTTEANREVGAVHSKAMPVILTQSDDLDVWMNRLYFFSGLYRVNFWSRQEC